MPAKQQKGATKVVLQVQSSPPAKPPSKKGKGKKNKRNKRVDGGVKYFASRTSMPECTAKFLDAIARPFSTNALGACLPFAPDRDSLKVTTITRFNAYPGLDGAFVVALCPSLANDLPSAYQTGTSASGLVNWPNTVTWPLVTGNGSYYSANTPFTAAQIAAGGVSGRIVSVGIRISYIGQVATMSGMNFAYVSPEHINTNVSAYNIDGMLSTVDTKVCRVSNRPFEMGMTVCAPNEHKYTGANETSNWDTAKPSTLIYYPWSSGIDFNNKRLGQALYMPLWGSPIATFGVAGAATGTTFYVEIIQHMEFVGKMASFGLTPSHNDEAGAAKVTAAAERASAEFNAAADAHWTSTVYKTFKETVAEHSGTILKTGANVAMRVALSRMNRPHGAPMLQA